MKTSELRKLSPPPPPEKGSRAFVRIFEAGAVVAIALLGYSVYAGLLEIPGLRGSAVSSQPQAQPAPRSAAVIQPDSPSDTPSSQVQARQGPASIASLTAVRFFERQQPGDQTRFVSCVKMTGYEWRKVINALQAGIEPVTSQFATCMLSLNPGRLCEPSEVQNLTGFLQIYMEQKISTAQRDPDKRPEIARTAAPIELRTATASAALDKQFLTDMRDLIAQGYLRISDVGNILPVEAQAALAAVTVERIACR